MKKKHIITIIVAILASVVAVCLWVGWPAIGRVFQTDTHIAPTAAEIMSVMPRGELYVATAVVEDYTTDHATEYHLGIIPEQHSCALVMRQKVSFVIDMDSIRYDITAPGHVLVTLPQPRYVASTQEVRFLSDDEAFWKERRSSTADMKSQVTSQIHSRFDNAQNRNKAIIYAQEAIIHLLQRLDYDAEFRPMATRTIEG